MHGIEPSSAPTRHVPARAVGEPLRIASLAKQVPQAESLRLDEGRLVRRDVPFEMNPYCRRAVAQGVTLARETGGSCTVVTLGPPSAEDVLREAVAWGADKGVHLCDEAFAGSDSLASARALAAALEVAGPFDLVLLGRNSIDGETGQVGPELAELLGLPFASGVRRLEDAGAFLRLELEHDDGTQEVEITMPALLTVAERLCDPCKVDLEGRAAVDAKRLQRITAAELGPGPWGAAGSPTEVGSTRPLEHERALLVFDGPIEDQVRRTVEELVRRDAWGTTAPSRTPPSDPSTSSQPMPGARAEAPSTAGHVVAVLAEPGRPQVTAELLGAARGLAGDIRGVVHVLAPEDVSGTIDVATLVDLGADLVITLEGVPVPEDVSDAVSAYVGERRPWALLAPSTAFGREVAGRAAAATGAGLVGDAVALSVQGGALVAAKPAFAGALVADITSRSTTQMATIRPGMLPVQLPTAPTARRQVAASADNASETHALGRQGRLRIVGQRRNDDVETLARAQVVIGVGTGVTPDEYELLSPLAAVLGAELAATRKVTDKGWAPRARQVGITGRSIAPRLYIALALSGKFNHMVGVRGADTVLAINTDRDAPVFTHCDVGIVGDWHEALPLLVEGLRGDGRRDAASIASLAGDLDI